MPALTYTRAELLALLAACSAQGAALTRALAAAPAPVTLPGVNLAGADFGALTDTRPIGQSHVYPADEAFAYWAGVGMKLVRLPFRIERVQPVAGGPFADAEIREIDRCVAAAGKNGLQIVLDAHNYGQRGTTKITAEDLAAFWGAMAARYKGFPQVNYGIMNEPYVFTAAEWQPVLRAACGAIRKVSPTQRIMAPGSGWTGAHSFVANGDGTAFNGFSDPNAVIEVHQYLDHDSSGQNVQEYTPGAGSTRLAAVTGWARQQGRKLFLGEFGFAMPAGEKEASDLLQFMNDNSDVWLGYAIWAGGPWWGDYAFAVEPKNGQDAPQVAVIKRFM